MLPDLEILQVCSSALGFDQEPRQQKSQQHAHRAEHDEGPPPTVKLTDQPPEEAAGNGSDIDAGLVSAHGTGTCFLSVIVANHRHRSGKVEGLSEPFGSTEKQELLEVGRQSCEHANDAPGPQPAEYGGLAPDPVNNVAGERSADSIDQRER